MAHLPWALIGTAGISCLIYFMLALSLALLTYPSISVPAFLQFPCAPAKWAQSGPTIGFTAAFVYAHCEFVYDCAAAANTRWRLCHCQMQLQAEVFLLGCRPNGCPAGMKWMQYIVSLAALLGILTALTVGLFSVSRIVMVASRDWLLPPFLARISPRTQTPLVAQMVFGLIIGECSEGQGLGSGGTGWEPTGVHSLLLWVA